MLTVPIIPGWPLGQPFPVSMITPILEIRRQAQRQSKPLKGVGKATEWVCSENGLIENV